MPDSLFEWSPEDSPAETLDVRTPADWQQLMERYAGQAASRPLARIFAIAQELGVESVLIEHRYIDADWRSQHAEFYGSTFLRYPSVCHRLHFFTAQVPSDLDNLDALQDAYRGYAVMRPLKNSPVGRTMISPPPEMDGGVVTLADETVHLFGWDLTIRAMPFISQDAQYLRCGHASLWMVLRYAASAHQLPQQLPGDIHEACSGGAMVGRQVPSAGLSLQQMLVGSTRLGLSMARLNVPAFKQDPQPGDLTLYNIVCRYVSSELPPIVLSKEHAWVIVGWKRTPSGGHPQLTLWRHDDMSGPYIRVENPYEEQDPAHKPWIYILMPLMPKMYIAAERAEVCGTRWMTHMLTKYRHLLPDVDAIEKRGDLTYRTYAVQSSAYKRRLQKRGLNAELARFYRLGSMPKYIWVVEAVDRQARELSKPDVLGEILLDSTVSEHLRVDSGEPVLSAHLGTVTYSSTPDHKTSTVLRLPPGQPYISDLYSRTDEVAAYTPAPVTPTTPRRTRRRHARALFGRLTKS